MGQNQRHGTYVENRHDGMRGYDLLPPEIRELMRNSIHSFATLPRLGMLKAGMSVSELRSNLMERDVRLCRRAATAEFGDQADDFIAAQKPRRVRDWFDRPPRSRL